MRVDDVASNTRPYTLAASSFPCPWLYDLYDAHARPTWVGTVYCEAVQ